MSWIILMELCSWREQRVAISNIVDNRTLSLDEDTSCDVVFEIVCDDHDTFGIPREVESFTEWVTKTTVYSAIMQGMQFRPKVIMHLYDEGTIAGQLKTLMKEQIHPRMKSDPLDFTKLSKKLWKPY